MFVPPTGSLMFGFRSSPSLLSSITPTPSTSRRLRHRPRPAATLYRAPEPLIRPVSGSIVSRVIDSCILLSGSPVRSSASPSSLDGIPSTMHPCIIDMGLALPAISRQLPSDVHVHATVHRHDQSMSYGPPPPLPDRVSEFINRVVAHGRLHAQDRLSSATVYGPTANQQTVMADATSPLPHKASDVSSEYHCVRARQFSLNTRGHTRPNGCSAF